MQKGSRHFFLRQGVQVWCFLMTVHLSTKYGPNDLGSLGQKRATVGVLTANARCMGPVSPTIKTEKRCMRAASV